jgi:iron-sulfur cluster assembly 1
VRKPQTDEASHHLLELLSRKPEALGIRLGVKTRGCNGMSYTMNYALEGEGSKFDEELVVNGVKVFIEPRALLTIIGTVMDWRSDDVKEGFVFENPQATAVCGCGESFTVGAGSASPGTSSAPPTSAEPSSTPPTSSSSPAPTSSAISASPVLFFQGLSSHSPLGVISIPGVPPQAPPPRAASQTESVEWVERV